MSRKKSKKKNEYLINTIEYSTWENELTLSRTFGDVVSTYIRTKCLPVVVQPVDTHVVSDVVLIRNNDSSFQDDLNVDVEAVDCEQSSTQQCTTTTEHGIVRKRTSTTRNPQITTADVPGSSTIVLQPSTSSFTPSISASSLHRLKSLMKHRRTVPLKENSNTLLDGYSLKSEETAQRQSSNRFETLDRMKKGTSVALNLAKLLVTQSKSACNIPEDTTEKSAPKDGQDMPLHSGVRKSGKQFACEFCDYKCSRKNDLTKHIRTHTKEKPFSCVVCDHKSSTKGHLIVHLRTHTGEKPFTCDVCDYKCSQKSLLTEHIRTHTGEKPFACDVCDYKCTAKSNLTKHIRTHTGEKPHVCNVCDYRFSAKGNLTRHMRRHQKEKQDDDDNNN